MKKKIVFIILFLYLCIAEQVIFSSEQLYLTTDIPETPELVTFRINLGKSIKKIINKFLKNNPKVQAELKASRKEIKVLPQPIFHYTHLSLGNMPVNKFEQITQIILDTLNDQSLNLKKDLSITIPGNSELQLLNNFVVLIISIPIKWFNFSQILSVNLEQQAQVTIEHFTKYQKGDWKPHITINKITNREYLDKIDVRTGKTLRQLILEEIITYNNNVKKIMSTFNVGALQLDHLKLTYKLKMGQYKLVSEFKFNAKNNTWEITYPAQKSKNTNIMVTSDKLYILNRELRTLAGY